MPNTIGDYPNNLPPRHLTTTALDCSRLLGSELHFQRWLGVEWSAFDHASISASTDGDNWVIVWDHDAGGITDTTWVPQSYDISFVADGQPAVYLRWTMCQCDYIATYPGWNIDDVEIRGLLITRPGDYDGDGLIDLDDFAMFVDCYTGPDGEVDSACARTDLDLDGDADMADLRLFQLAFDAGGP